jgi:PadR family transcriptional regulator
MTIQVRLVLRELLSAGDREAYGLEIVRATGLKSGAVHPILARLERAGWVISRREDADPKKEGRPVRTYYRLTPDGEKQATADALRPMPGEKDSP